MITIFSAALSILPQTIQADRERLLAPFFKPRPGEMLSVSPREMAIQRRGDTLLTKGEIWITPPPGQCLMVRKDPTRRDLKFCRKLPLTWEIFDLDGRGSLHLTIVTGSKDEGTHLSWPTPYRIANYVPLDGAETDLNFNVPIKSCTPSSDLEQRKITLELMDGRRWLILLPDLDQPAPNSEVLPPNLIVRVDSRKDAEGKTQKNAVVSPPTAEGEEPTKKHVSALSQLLSGEYKSEKKIEFPFRLPKRNAYEMSSSHFMETSVPQGMNGRCRYVFKGAPGDAESGAIECFSTDTFDAVYAPVTCFSAFSPRRTPASSAPPAGAEGS